MKEFNVMIHLISIVNNRWNEHIKALLKSHNYIGVVPNHGPILKTISEKNGDVTVTEIAERTNRPKPTITESLNKLEKLGFLTKTRDEVDKRIVYTKLTETGIVLDQFMADEVEGFLEETLKDFNLEERSVLLELLHKCSMQ